jgi:NTP pyrophosphatase (non-canonical NTP hydrolase)
MRQRDRVDTVLGKIVPARRPRKRACMRLKDIHRARDAGPGCDLRMLQIASDSRTNDPKGFDHKGKPWSVLEWAGATGGELGEASNLAKKILRLRYGQRGNKKGDRSEARLLRKLRREIADTICYLVAWASTEGFDVSDDVERVFNDKSKELGYDFML